MKKEKQVLVRTYSAGVHFGVLVKREGQEVHLKNARRLWSWSGAFSLSENAKTCFEAKASTFGKKESEFKPTIET